ncbi:MAG: VOC family protein [Chloroflexi bacterium]|nr:VOC family protein [Chloroflexota bacterium]
MITRFSHFGHAVKSIDEVLPVYEKLWGLKPSYRGKTPDGTVNALIPVGKNYIELLQPTTPQGPLARFLAERGEGIYHLCWIVEDLGKAVKHLRAQGVRVNETPTGPDMPFGQAWLHPQSTMGLLIELVEEGRMARQGHQPHPEASTNPEMQLTHVHHAVKDIEAAITMYERLWDIHSVHRLTTQGQGVNNSIMKVGRDRYVELLEPAAPGGVLDKYIQKRGEGLRSLCLTVRDYARAVRDLRARGIEVAEYGPEAGNFPIHSAWISPRYTRGLLTEISEHREMLSFQDPGWKDE